MFLKCKRCGKTLNWTTSYELLISCGKKTSNNISICSDCYDDLKLFLNNQEVTSREIKNH